MSAIRNPASGAAWMERRLQHRIAGSFLLCTIAAAGCSDPNSLVCPNGAGEPMLIATLYFGMPLGARAEESWQSFVNETIAISLPDGFTVSDAQGAWRNPWTGRSVREKSKVIVAAVADTAERRAALNHVRRAYERAFSQQVVGLTTLTACADFHSGGSDP